MASPQSGLTTLLARLAASGTDFILVGALAAVAQGAPLTTLDVDVVHRREPGNVDRLIAFLDSVDARYRGRPAGQVLRTLAELKRGTTSAKGLLALAVLEETLRRKGQGGP
jgi:hypothetical protein